MVEAADVELNAVIKRYGATTAVDGISLTVNQTAADRFAVNIIPHSWQHTNLRERKVGDRVNIEVDMLARYVARQLAFRAEI